MFQPFAVRDDEAGYLEHGAGLLRPEACVAAQLALARRKGAEVRLEEPATGFAADGDGVRVRTAGGEYRARRAVVTAGPWLPGLLGDTWRGRFTVAAAGAALVRDHPCVRPTRFILHLSEKGEHFPNLDHGTNPR